MTYSINKEFFNSSENSDEYINEDKISSQEIIPVVENEKNEKNEKNTDKVHRGHGNHTHNLNKPKTLETNEFNIQKNKWHWFQVTSVCIIKSLITIIAMYLVWDCSQKENIILKIINLLIVFFVPELYIIYYAIYRVFLGIRCY